MHPRKNQIWLDKFDGQRSFLQASGFMIVNGLAGKGISFKSGNSYLYVSRGQLFLGANNGKADFKRSASFMVRFGLGAGKAGFGISFESVGAPGHFITESHYRVIIAKMVNSASWKSDATWKPIVAQISTKTVTQTVTQTSHSMSKFMNFLFMLVLYPTLYSRKDRYLYQRMVLNFQVEVD